MADLFRRLIGSILSFLASPVKRYLLLIFIIISIAVVDYFTLGLARRTFVFYNIDSGEVVVEGRMLRNSRVFWNRTREQDIIQYVEETLLGPKSPDSLPLFPRETILRSLLLRDRVIYVDFSTDAALPPVEGGNALDNFRTLYDGILRNFSYINDVRFFVEGNSVFFDSKNEEVKEDFRNEEVFQEIPEFEET